MTLGASPHNLSILMFSPSSVNVICFDPQRGADQARSYAGKYASKPERWYFLEAEKSGLQHWLKCRTIGVCQAWNRIWASSQFAAPARCNGRPVTSARTRFTPASGTSSTVPGSLTTPDPERLLSYTQRYFFR